MAFNIQSRIAEIFNSRKDRENEKLPALQDKVNSIYESGAQNPFLKKDGSLVNPYINYQKLLDNANVSRRAKSYITEATGLKPAEASETKVTATAMPNKALKTAVEPQNAAKVQTATESSIVDSAKKFLGTPYVWGGESMAEGGMDCSGFVYSALKNAGYNVGRTTAQGYRNYGTQVDKNNLQAGDLIFFGTADKATHIGIYIGNGQMIHSSGGSKNTKDNPGKGVSIANVDYRNDFLEARRY